MQLEHFLVKAKINTYAGGGEGLENLMDDRAKEMVYEEDGWKYRDRYFGFNPFMGQEVVWKDGKLVWGMNYRGEIISDIIDGKKIYSFLKKSLMQVKIEKPFRGLDNYSEDDLVYKDKCSGNIDSFEGEENIYFKGNKVYELKYLGGKII